ncbi:sulfite exporter TauE/SafE family protein [Sphingobacterium corticis]|uniref:Probable membrane transporter protein n=1 Tax=Sphingobacterium corticis TaxID=1812823 RepID=A0ABW5NGZ9_9SPHI
MMELLGYALAILIGVSLGLIGSGGSILTIPILVYCLDIEPLTATAYSLFIVGISSLIGGFRKALEGMVDYKVVFYFGIPSIFMVLFTRTFIMPSIPAILFSDSAFAFSKQTMVMVLFAIVMLLASASMIRDRPDSNDQFDEPKKFNYLSVFFKGITLGIVTGMVGAGGGFLIIPTLVISARMAMKRAIGTSLFIVAFNSLVGFLGYWEIDDKPINWTLLLIFSAFSIIGIFFGAMIAKKMDGEKLKVGFGWFVLAMGLYIFIREVLL